MNKSELAYFERISHILIEEGFGDFFVKTHLIDELGLSERIQLFFEKKLPLSHRVKNAAIRCGPSFVHFVKYISTRTDILNPKLCFELGDIEFTNESMNGTVEVPIITIDGISHVHDTNATVYFDGFSFRTALKPKKNVTHKKGKKQESYQLHFLEKQILTQYHEDLNILFFFAKIIDSQCHFKFSATRVVHEYLVEVNQRFKLSLHIAHAKKMKGALSQYDTIALPGYLQKKSTDHHILVKEIDGITADEIPKAIVAYHDYNEAMMENLSTMLFSPIFTHGFLLKEIDFDNIVLREKGNVGLNHIPALTQLTQIEVATITTFFSGLIEKDHEQVLESLGIVPASKTYAKLRLLLTHKFNHFTHLDSNHIEEILEIIDTEAQVPPHFFEIIQLMHICEEIQFHFQIKRTILVLLKPHVEKNLKLLLKHNISHNKKLSKAQKILFSDKHINTDIRNLYVNHSDIRKHLTYMGLTIIIFFTFLLILELNKANVTLVQILTLLLASLLLTRITKHHIIRHSKLIKKK